LSFRVNLFQDGTLNTRIAVTITKSTDSNMTWQITCQVILLLHDY